MVEIYEIHPRRNFLIFCTAVHMAGACASIVTEMLDDIIHDDMNDYAYSIGLPLIALPIAYLIYFKRLTSESDTAVGKHFKEIGIWLLTVFPMGAVLFVILSAFCEMTELYEAGGNYIVYLLVCTLSICFVTPFYKLGRIIVSAIRKKDDDYYRYYGGM